MSGTLTLFEIMEGIEYTLKSGQDTPVSGIAYDSRTLQEGDVYFALTGGTFDGAEFIDDAIEKGCSAVVTEKAVDRSFAPLLITTDSRSALAFASSAFYGHPSRELKLIGITGTHGKTSVAFILRYLLQSDGHRTAIMGTIGNDLGSGLIESKLTTLEAPEINKFLRDALKTGSTHAVMEVSSHSLSMKRTAGLAFDVALFTNLTHDHLDFHGDFDSYRESKAMLFNDLSSSSKAILNKDDSSWEKMVSSSPAGLITYSLSDSTADYHAESYSYSSDGLRLNLITPDAETEIKSSLVGEFNIYNLMAAYAAAEAVGAEPGSDLSELPQIPGRLEKISIDSDFTVLVDYAHTPDALKNAINASREILSGSGKLITVFGCGGDRDREKRPLMGKVASTLSDFTIITSDNPRGEKPEAVISEILTGMVSKAPFESIPDRRAALKRALKIAGTGDVVLIAGKGHEAYQEVMGVRTKFSDKEALIELMEQLNI